MCLTPNILVEVPAILIVDPVGVIDPNLVIKGKTPLEVLSHHQPIIVKETLFVDSLCQFLTEISVLEVELKLEIAVVFRIDLDVVLVILIVIVVVLLKVQLLVYSCDVA